MPPETFTVRFDGPGRASELRPFAQVRHCIALADKNRLSDLCAFWRMLQKPRQVPDRGISCLI
jgi:hypothetical protein